MCVCVHVSPTLKPVRPFLQQTQASMRKTKVKIPDRDTATTVREDDQDSPLSVVPSAGHIKNYTPLCKQQPRETTLPETQIAAEESVLYKTLVFIRLDSG